MVVEGEGQVEPAHRRGAARMGWIFTGGQEAECEITLPAERVDNEAKQR